MSKNLLKEKLVQGKPVFGTAMVTNSFDIAQVLTHIGLDCVMLDAEHGSMDIESAGRLVTAIQTDKTTPLLRIPTLDLALVKRGLDTGAEGIVIPMINTKEQAQQAVQYCKYPPKGIRGIGASRAAWFGTGFSYWGEANEETLVILQVEHPESVKNVYDILSVPGIDIALIGPGDLSTAMGVQGFDHPDMKDAYKKVLDACKKNNVFPGIVTFSGLIKQNLDMGFKFLLGGVDSMIIFSGMHSLLAEFNNSLA